MLSDAATRVLAAAVLLVLFALLAVRVNTLRCGMGVSYRQLPIYLFNLMMTRIRWRARIEGSVALPPEQGAVIVCNHIGPVDPAFIALACDRPVHWMVAREYCELPLVGHALKMLEVIPTGRKGIDTAATKLALRYAERGELVGMFPEGRINDSGCFLLPGRAGAALVALKARVPVVPCFIAGSPYGGSVFRFFLMTAKARLKVGRPIDISEYYGRESDREILRALTIRIMREIALLGGQPDYEPSVVEAQKNSRKEQVPGGQRTPSVSGSD